MLRADTLTYTVTPSAGQFLYDFTLTNTGTAGGSLFDLFLLLPTDISNIDTATIGTPAGWGDSLGGLLFFGPDVAPSTSFIEWSADASRAFDLGVANSLAGFSFTSSADIGGPITYALNGSTDFVAAQQATTGPTAPEPASLLLILSGIAVISLRRRLFCLMH